MMHASRMIASIAGLFGQAQKIHHTGHVDTLAQRGRDYGLSFGH
jgi:hypothetical protein